MITNAEIMDPIDFWFWATLFVACYFKQIILVSEMKLLLSFCCMIVKIIKDLLRNNNSGPTSSTIYIWILNICLGFRNRIRVDIKYFERSYPYHFFWANQQKIDIKIFLWTQSKINKDPRDWHILAANDQRIISHNLNRLGWKIFGSFNNLAHLNFSRYAFLSDYLTDLYTGKSKKKFVTNYPQWGLKPGPPDHEANALPTELGWRSVGQKISEVSFVCFMHHFTCCTLFISRINRAWLYKGHEDSGWQLNVDIVQLVEHWPNDLEVLVSIPTGGNFQKKFLLFPVQKFCQIIWEKRLSWKTQLSVCLRRFQLGYNFVEICNML